MSQFSPTVRGTKICQTCGKERSLFAFKWRDDQLSGLMESCRTCINLRAAPYETAYRLLRRERGHAMTTGRWCKGEAG